MQTDNMAQLNEFQINSDNFPLLSFETLIARSEIPTQHKLIAQNYMVIKRIYGTSSVPLKITNAEEAFLKENNFDTIENVTARKMQEELNLLRKLATSDIEEVRLKSDMLFAIRVKELKYLYASNYFPPMGEIYNGWQFLEKYIEYIAK
ncbi:MAG: hypothetical protein E7Z91_00330 [Cyanobacteria bacterium SIG30]|nr:hypothetical protein [Cyanobacteria bacterium SIG30]